ncbi:tRNA (32-2'-O)-methyltransferase regulator THADA [Anabrus simplex]|uniref:tRNA (32-2'-O)-methyltransferase regulator THADA n=1 Tax=Anabrus simplex TaxID=316456 RepID=UPI0035A35E82
MTTMVLRSGGKSGSSPLPASNDRKRIKSVTIDVSLLEEAKIFQHDGESLLHSEVANFSATKTVEEQLVLLKSMAKKYFSNDDHSQRQLHEYFIKFLIEIFVQTELKSPLKCAVARLLSSSNELLHETSTKCLSSRLQLLMTDLKKTEAHADKHFTVNTLAGCFNNFDMGVRALMLCCNDALHFLKDCLDSYILVLGSELSPAKKMEVYQFIHAAIRVTVAILQKCQQGAKPAGDLNRAEDGSRIVDNPADKTVLSQIFKPAAFLISYQDLPMDTKSNCGLMIVLLAVLVDEDEGWTRLLCQVTMDIQEPDAPYHSVTVSSDVSRLCLCSGLLSALPMNKLSQRVSASSHTVVELLFYQFLAIGKRNTSESSLVLAVSRSLQLLTRSICSAVQRLNGETIRSSAGYVSLLDHAGIALPTSPLQQNEEGLSADTLRTTVKNILNDALQFVWTHLEHYMDSVRHAARTMLQNLVMLGIHFKSSDSGILETITNAAISIPPYRKCCYTALSTLAAEVGCQNLLKLVPDLVSKLLSMLEDAGLMTHVASAFETLMLSHEAENSGKEWQKVWLTPLLSALDHSNANTCAALEDILSKAIKRCPSAVDHVLPSTSEAIPYHRLRTVLACLKICRRQGALDNLSESDSKWKSILDYYILEEALCHVEDDIRLSAFALLAESHRSTEPFLPSELRLIRIFLKHNINTDVPAARQQTLAHLKKILVRMKDSSLAEQRKKDSQSALLESYKVFQMWMVEFGFSNLFPGANFGRRCSALQLLTLYEETFDPKVPVCMWTRGNADMLLECLKDTYENNKLLALRLLLHFPYSVLQFDNVEYVASLLLGCLQLVSSNRPPDCITAAYLLRCIVGFSTSSAIREVVLEQLKIRDIETNSSSDVTDEWDQKDLVLQIIKVVKHKLERELAVAKSNLLMAAGTAPMYGSLFCIRQLLQDVDLSSLSGNANWRRLVSELISLCFELNNTVAAVVNSSSPEGHLPMDMQPGVEQLEHIQVEQKTTCEEPPSVMNVTAQMLLLCSWRTVKEVSLFLGEISERAPVLTKPDEEGLVTEEQLLLIGDHFTTLLAETKHRGAFEQAYIGFCSLCTRLWRHPDGVLHQLPAQWLQQLMDAITAGTGTKLCATRRSAGVPFMVQALVTTELQVGGSLQCFQQSMFTLLKLASTGDTVEVRTHALNILRALYRHAQLGELVTPYVADGVMVAIRGFKGNTWAERNSATLLFSAIMTRIFGVARSRDSLSIRNRMTGRIFFLRYPVLFDFLLEELRVCTENLTSDPSSVASQPSLFPVLLVLARLYPSSLEGTDSCFQLSDYIPFVERCAGCPVMKTRVLAARALVPLITPNIYEEHLNHLFTIVSDKQDIGRNFRQGILLQIVHLLYELQDMSDMRASLKPKIELWVTQSKWLLNPEENICGVCYITCESYLQVLQRFISMNLGVISDTLLNEIKELLTRDLFSPDSAVHACCVGRSIYELRAGQVLINLSLQLLQSHRYSEISNEIEVLVLKFLGHTSYEVHLIALTFLYILFEDNDISDDDDFDVTEIELSCVLDMDPYCKEVLRNIIKKSVHILDVLINLATSSDTYQGCSRRVFEVLSHIPEALLRMKCKEDCDDKAMKSAGEVMTWLLEESVNKHESVGCVVLKCAGMLVDWLIQHGSQAALPKDVADNLCHVLLEFSSAERSLECRSVVAEILLRNSSMLETTPANFFSALNVCSLWTAVIMLLDDDDLNIRNTVASLARSLIPTLDVPVVAHYARELLVAVFVSCMHRPHPVLCIATLMAWSLHQLEDDSGGDDIEERVFDKGEMNVFAEGVVLTELACKYLEQVLDIELVTAPLEDEIKHWLYTQCWPSNVEEVTDNMKDVSSLSDFINFTKDKILHVKHHSEYSHFFVPDQKPVIVATYKVLRVLKAMPQ